MSHLAGPGPFNEVPSELYTREYYLSDNDGCREYQRGLDVAIHPKFQRPLELITINEGMNVLDVGCGRGELIYYCAQKGAYVLGLDYSKDAVELSQETINQLPAHRQSLARADVGNAESYAYSQKFDAIFMIEVAEHMQEWQLKEAFKKFYDILNKDGYLVVTTPNYLYEKYLQPLKYILDIPCRLIKWPLRILRGKYKPKTKREIFQKIFRIWVDRGERNKQMHCNIMTPKKLKHLLKDFDTKVLVEDKSVAPISLLLRKWMGVQLIAIARKK